ncbi:helix-turn-helix domain-containing protein [Peribacillus frigoritolerans]|uniref:helix-turn-helix domain-containing protein n=1 Tax=Peribacillus frigoritolerans TaxID=450367 RepID=UPI001F500212|nr:helix-turn-helix transcriptional regulator [Peribacillus frigoritolerans]MCK2020512.1 helix-turn-helix domain-containing protein [Peribacillus frigoritolerans]
MLGLEYIVKQKNMSYTSLARELGVSTQNVHKWVKKIKPIPQNHLKRLVEIFNVDEDYIKSELTPSMVEGVEKQEVKNTLDQSFLTYDSPNQVVNIAFQPTSDHVAKRNFEKTITQPVPLSIIQQHLDPNEVEDLHQMYNDKDIEVWGVKEGQNGATKKQYDKLSVGDIVLFYKDWFLYRKAIVTYKAHSPELAEKLWNDKVFEHIYFLTNVETIRVPVELVNETLYPKNNNYRFPFMGFKVLSSEQSELLMNKLELETESQLKEVTVEDYQKAVTLEINKPLDTLSKRVRRVEQGYLRKLLFGKKLYAKCACCANYFPTSHLFAAHLKKRSLCNVEEKLDSQIVMPMCKFGCDTLYEDGYISVDSTGHFVGLDKLMGKKVTPRVEDILAELDGRKCSYWNENTVKYFEWHYDYHTKM